MSYLENQSTFTIGDCVTFMAIEETETHLIFAQSVNLPDNPKFKLNFGKKFRIYKISFDYIMEAWFYYIEYEEKERSETKIMYKIFEKNNKFYHYIPQAYFIPTRINMLKAEQV